MVNNLSLFAKYKSIPFEISKSNFELIFFWFSGVLIGHQFFFLFVFLKGERGEVVFHIYKNQIIMNTVL